MSQFGDYESLFHGEALHCGLVARQRHRHWVHVVGTEYDLVEWDEPQPADLGVGTPLAAQAIVEVPAARRSAAARLAELLSASEEACLACLSATNDDEEEAVNMLLAGGPPPPTPSAPPEIPAVSEDDDGTDEPFAMLRTRLTPRRAQPPQGISFANCFTFNGIIYDRHFDFYSALPHCGLPESEAWLADFLAPLLRIIFPADDEKKKISYKLLLPRVVMSANSPMCRLMGCSDADKENATWKEVVCWRARKVLHVFNLVSHGRHTYRSLVYTNDSRFSLFPLPLNLGKDAMAGPLLNQAGSFRRSADHGASLMILRRNPRIHGTERFIPKALLAGAVPSAILDNYRFWLGEDGKLRTEIIDPTSQWFGYHVEVIFDEHSIATVRRHPPGVSCSQVQKPTEDVSEATMLVRQTSVGRPERSDVKYDDATLAGLAALGFGVDAVKLALRECNHHVGRAAQWLYDERHSEQIRACVPTSMDVGDGKLLTSEVQELLDLGFSKTASEHALQRFGQLQAAAAWLSDESNKAEIAELSAGPASPGPLSRSVSVAGEAQGDMLLLNLLEAPDGSVLFRIASVLSRVEDLSYILAWTTSHNPRENESCQVSLIELPRLKLRLQPQRGPDGVTRLHLSDRAGWYISDVFSSMGHHASASLQTLIGRIPHCLVSTLSFFRQFFEERKNHSICFSYFDVHGGLEPCF